MNDDFLTRFRKSPRPEFAATLYKRISRPMSMSTSKPMSRSLFPRQRLAFVFAAVALMLAATLIVSPKARTLAAGLWNQISVLTFSDRPVGEPVLIEPATAEQVALAQATATPMAAASLEGTPLEVAIRSAGFQPYLPGYLPSGFVEVETVAAEYVDDDGVPTGMGIFTTYVSNSDGYLAIQTSRFDGRAQDIPTGGTSLTDVTVNGQSGVWIEGLPFESNLTPSRTLNMLLWEQGEFVLAIQADQLSLSEVLRIADSLSQ